MNASSRTQSRFADAGLSAESYAKQLIEDGIILEQRARTQSFNQIAAPLRREFKKSGTSDEQLGRLVNAARTRHHERSGSRKKRSVAQAPCRIAIDANTLSV